MKKVEAEYLANGKGSYIVEAAYGLMLHGNSTNLGATSIMLISRMP